MLLGMAAAAAVMAAMAVRFMRLAAEKWTPQRRAVFKKTERAGGLNTSTSQTG